jgi:hypothetical protein
MYKRQQLQQIQIDRLINVILEVNIITGNIFLVFRQDYSS